MPSLVPRNEKTREWFPYNVQWWEALSEPTRRTFAGNGMHVSSVGSVLLLVMMTMRPPSDGD